MKIVRNLYIFEVLPWANVQREGFIPGKDPYKLDISDINHDYRVVAAMDVFSQKLVPFLIAAHSTNYIQPGQSHEVPFTSKGSFLGLTLPICNMPIPLDHEVDPEIAQTARAEFFERCWRDVVYYRDPFASDLHELFAELSAQATRWKGDATGTPIQKTAKIIPFQKELERRKRRSLTKAEKQRKRANKGSRKGQDYRPSDAQKRGKLLRYQPNGKKAAP